MFTFITVFLIEILAGAEVDIFVPSFPQLQREFGLTPFMVELALGLNLAANCICSLLVGNLGDRYGRKPTILIGLTIFIIGSILCSFATSYNILLLGRILQGIGMAGPAVLGYLVVADLYTPKAQQQIMGILNGAITVAMACAPVIGSYVSMWFGWRGNFVILLSLGTLCFLLSICFIPKAEINHTISLSPKEYLPVLRSKKAMYYILTTCFITIAYWTFIGIAPILYMESLGVSLSHFGFYQGALAGAFSIFSLSSGYFLRIFGEKHCFNFSIGLLLIFLVLTIIAIIFEIKDPLIITIICLIESVGVVIPINILWPLSLEAIPTARARITAVFASLRLILTAVFIQAVSYAYDGTFAYLGIAMIFTTIVALWFCYKLYGEENFLNIRHHEEG